jgi:hypothetical protein
MAPATVRSWCWGGWRYLGIACGALILVCALAEPTEAVGGLHCTQVDVHVLMMLLRSLSQRLALLMLLIGAGSAAQRQSLGPLMTGVACVTGTYVLPYLLGFLLAACALGLPMGVGGVSGTPGW